MSTWLLDVHKAVGHLQACVENAIVIAQDGRGKLRNSTVKSGLPRKKPFPKTSNLVQCLFNIFYWD